MEAREYWFQKRSLFLYYSEMAYSVYTFPTDLLKNLFHIYSKSSVFISLRARILYVLIIVCSGTLSLNLLGFPVFPLWSCSSKSFLVVLILFARNSFCVLISTYIHSSKQRTDCHFFERASITDQVELRHVTR